MTKTSRRRFGRTLAALTSAAAPVAAQKKQEPAQAEEKSQAESKPAPCSVNPGLAEYNIPRGTEPSFTFKA